MSDERKMVYVNLRYIYLYSFAPGWTRTYEPSYENLFLSHLTWSPAQYFYVFLYIYTYSTICRRVSTLPRRYRRQRIELNLYTGVVLIANAPWGICKMHQETKALPIPGL